MTPKERISSKKEMTMSSQMLYAHRKYREEKERKRLSDTLWYIMGLSDTFRKDTEKGEAVVFKCRSDSHSQTNRSELTQRNAQISGIF